MLEGRKLEARRWFQQARHDLRAEAWNIEGGFHDTASFLAQQSAEKATKAEAATLKTLGADSDFCPQDANQAVTGKAAHRLQKALDKHD
jgi:hypothetical protein